MGWKKKSCEAFVEKLPLQIGSGMMKLACRDVPLFELILCLIWLLCASLTSLTPQSPEITISRAPVNTHFIV